MDESIVVVASFDGWNSASFENSEFQIINFDSKLDTDI